MKRFVAVLMLAGGLLVAGGANAVVTVLIQPSGSDVVVSVSGSLINVTLSNSSVSFPNLRLGPNPTTIVTGSSSASYKEIAVSTIPNIGPNPIVNFANSGANDQFAIDGGQNIIFVPSNYTSGSSITSSATFNNETLCTLGITPGTYTISIPGGDSISIQATGSGCSTPSAVPTLSEWSQMLLGLLVMTMIGWHFHRERSY